MFPSDYHNKMEKKLDINHILSPKKPYSIATLLFGLFWPYFPIGWDYWLFFQVSVSNCCLLWHFTGDTWQLRPDWWHLTNGTWHMTHGQYWLLMLPFLINDTWLGDSRLLCMGLFRQFTCDTWQQTSDAWHLSVTGDRWPRHLTHNTCHVTPHIKQVTHDTWL